VYELVSLPQWDGRPVTAGQPALPNDGIIAEERSGLKDEDSAIPQCGERRQENGWDGEGLEVLVRQETRKGTRGVGLTVGDYGSDAVDPHDSSDPGWCLQQACAWPCQQRERLAGWERACLVSRKRAAKAV